MNTLTTLLGEFRAVRGIDAILTYEGDTRAYFLIKHQTVVLALAEEQLCIQALRSPREFDDNTDWVDQPIEAEQVIVQEQIGDEIWTLAAPPESVQSKSSLLQVNLPLAGLTPQKVNELMDSFAARLGEA